MLGRSLLRQAARRTATQTLVRRGRHYATVETGVRPLPLQNASFTVATKQNVDRQGVLVSASTGGGKTIKYLDALYLRDQCQCDQCVNPSSLQKKFATIEIPSDISVRSVEQNASGDLVLTWTNDIPGFPQDHKTTVPSWRVARALAGQTVDHEAFSPKPVSNTFLEQQYASGASRASYKDFLGDDKTFGRIVQELQLHGLAFFSDVPHDEESIVHLTERIGALRTTFYGRTWDVRDKPEATNVAYTSGYLGMHMDLLYMKEPPAIQLLHCLESSTEGGSSLFIDGLEAAKDIYLQDQKMFQALVDFPVSYHYIAPGTDKYFYDYKKTIELGPGLIALEGGKSMPMVLNMNWSPPFQAPFAEDTGSQDHGEALREYHRAATAYAKIVNDPARQFKIKMAPGECAIFHNRRMLHGRDAFSSETGARWLKGAYLDIDDFESRVRERYSRSVGQL